MLAPIAAAGQDACAEARLRFAAAERAFQDGDYPRAALGLEAVRANARHSACPEAGVRAAARLAEIRYRQARYADARSAALAALTAYQAAGAEQDRVYVLRACAVGAKAVRNLPASLEEAGDLARTALCLSNSGQTPPEIRLLAASAAARRSFDRLDYSAPRALVEEIKSLLAEHDGNTEQEFEEALFYGCEAVGDYYYYNHVGHKALQYKRQAAARLPALKKIYAPALYDSIKTELDLDLARLHRLGRNFDAALRILDQLAADTTRLTRRELRDLHSEYSRLLGRLNMMRDPNVQFPSSASGGTPDGPLWKKARRHGLRALELAEKDGEGRLEVGYNLGILHYYAFKYEEALSYLRAALPEQPEQPEPANDRAYTLVHGLIASTLNELGRGEEALAAVQAALIANSPDFSDPDPSANPPADELLYYPMLRHNHLSVKFNAFFVAGREKEAIAMLETVERYSEKLLGERLFASDRMHVKEQLSNCYNLAAQYFAAETGDLWKGLYYADKSRVNDGGVRFNGELVRLRNLQREYETLILLQQQEPGSTVFARKSFALEAEIDRSLESQSVSQRLPNVASSPDEFRRQMEAYVSARPGEAVVAYLTGSSQDTVWAFVLDENGLRLFKSPANFDSLLIQIGEFNRAIDSFYHYRANPYGYGGARGSGAFERYVEAGGKLRQWLLPPLEAAELKGKKLVLSPHGPLWALPWTAVCSLPDSVAGRYTSTQWYDRWGEQVFNQLDYPLAGRSIVLAYSLASLDSSARKPAARRPAAAFAPVFDDDSELAGPYFASRTSFLRQMEGLRNLRRGLDGALRLIPLPHTEKETAAFDQAARTAGRASYVALRSEATKSRFLQAARDGGSILHLATHAFYNPGASLLSGVVFSPEPGDSLFGGVLYPAEIYKMDLKQTDLVALSACQTSLGPIRKSEGQTGLSQAFLQAGARNVLSSLWSVNDEAAAEYMKAFYDGLFRLDLCSAEAMSHARAETMRAGFAAPFYWAGFRLVGR